jgi:hypothetical protein
MNHTPTTRATRLAQTVKLTTLTTLATVLLATGCKQEVLCPALGSCGGPRDQNGRSLPPISILPASDANRFRGQRWVLAPGHPSCSEDLYQPSKDLRLAGNGRGTGLGSPILPASGTPYPEPALYDWCVQLVAGAGSGDSCDPMGVCKKEPNFYLESGPIGEATIDYDDTGNFTTGITQTGTYTLVFPAYCMRAFGAMAPNVPAFDPTNICKQIEAPINSVGVGDGAFFNTTCWPNSEAGRREDLKYRARNPGAGLSPIDAPLDPGGCFCRYDAVVTGGPSGAYQIMDDQRTILHLSSSFFPLKATFCQQGDTLQLTGADGAYLFDRAGLRTLDFVRGCNTNAECTSGHCNADAVMMGLEPKNFSVPGICKN